MADQPVGFVYVAGPYTKGDVAENVRAAIEAADWLLNRGYVPYVPHLSHFWHLVHPHLYPEWIRLGLAWVERCDAVLRLPGDSDGADREVRHAHSLGIPVYVGLAEFGMHNEDRAS